MCFKIGVTVPCFQEETSGCTFYFSIICQDVLWFLLSFPLKILKSPHKNEGIYRGAIAWVWPSVRNPSEWITSSVIPFPQNHPPCKTDQILQGFWLHCAILWVSVHCVVSIGVSWFLRALIVSDWVIYPSPFIHPAFRKYFLSIYDPSDPCWDKKEMKTLLGIMLIMKSLLWRSLQSVVFNTSLGAVKYCGTRPRKSVITKWSSIRDHWKDRRRIRNLKRVVF